MRSDLAFEKFDRRRSLTAADYFAVTFGREHINAERDFISLRVALHVEGLYRGRVMMDHHRFAELTGEVGLVRRTQISAPLAFIFELVLFEPLVQSDVPRGGQECQP